ncbi:MAG: hypothetical protein EOP06_04355 [Proteobacteria bacterium]|nr:MAG: hypothetical protein EOP06_04355 [Pseudomonadota bacterium]
MTAQPLDQLPCLALNTGSVSVSIGRDCMLLFPKKPLRLLGNIAPQFAQLVILALKAVAKSGSLGKTKIYPVLVPPPVV